MATFAELQRERKGALREVRRKQRTVDTQMEVMERRLFSMLDKKNLLTVNNALELVDRYRRWIVHVKNFEKAIVDFLEVYRV